MAIDKVEVMNILNGAIASIDALPDVGDQSAQIAALQAQVSQLEADKVALMAEKAALEQQLAEKMALLSQVNLAAKAIDESIPD